MSYDFDVWERIKIGFTLGEETKFKRELESIIKNTKEKTVQKGTYLSACYNYLGID